MNPKASGTFVEGADGREHHVPYRPPDWYVAMKACAYVGEPFCQAQGLTYGPIVEAWALTAMGAEHEAEAYHAKKARG